MRRTDAQLVLVTMDYCGQCPTGQVSWMAQLRYGSAWCWLKSPPGVWGGDIGEWRIFASCYAVHLFSQKASSLLLGGWDLIVTTISLAAESHSPVPSLFKQTEQSRGVHFTVLKPMPSWKKNSSSTTSTTSRVSNRDYFHDLLEDDYATDELVPGHPRSSAKISGFTKNAGEEEGERFRDTMQLPPSEPPSCGDNLRPQSPPEPASRRWHTQCRRPVSFRRQPD